MMLIQGMLVITLDGIKLALPRRLQLADPSTDCVGQLAGQLCEDAVHAPSAATAVGALLEPDPYYSFVEIHPDSLQLSLMSTSVGDTIHLDVSSTSVTLHFPHPFLAADMHYMLNHLVQIVDRAISDRILLTPNISMINGEERSFMLSLPSCAVDPTSQIEDSGLVYRYGQDLIAHSLATRPNATAIEWEGRPRYTYAQLETASNQLCRYLVDELGVRPRDVVILVAEYSPYIVVAIYALLKAGMPTSFQWRSSQFTNLSTGCTYLPLDVEMPEDRLQHVVSMVDAKLLLTIEGLQQRLNSVSHNRTVVCLDTAAAKWDKLDGSYVDQSRLGNPDETLAYVNLTSGSTGLPKVKSFLALSRDPFSLLKGCMISHTNLVRWVVEASPMFDTNSESRYFQVSVLSGDSYCCPMSISY